MMAVQCVGYARCNSRCDCTARIAAQLPNTADSQQNISSRICIQARPNSMLLACFS
jgi:hypothetical protein